MVGRKETSKIPKTQACSEPAPAGSGYAEQGAIGFAVPRRQLVDAVAIAPSPFGDRPRAFLFRRSSAKRPVPVVKARDQTVSGDESAERPSTDRRRSASTPHPMDSRIATTFSGCDRGRTVVQMERAALCGCGAGKRQCAARHEPAPTSSGMKNVAMKYRMTPLSSDADDFVQEFGEAIENFMADRADAIQRHIVESVSLAGQRRLVRSRQGCRRTRGSGRENSRREGLARTALHPSNRVPGTDTA